ncbi:MAG: TonB-dependent receptor [candidate division FCPU426 bacterium]
MILSLLLAGMLHAGDLSPTAAVEFEEAEPVMVLGHRPGLIGRTEIPAKQIHQVAGAGGDIFRALQTLPGVAAISDFSGQLAVRGGGPRDNKTTLDDIPWPVPFHFGGILATIDSDLLESVDLLAGGFPARYGTADGAILEAHTRPGSREGFKGKADINLVTATVLLEGPLKIPGINASWTLSGRRSYFDLFLPHLADLDFVAFPYFWDMGLTLDFEFGPHNQLRFLALASDDVLAFDLTPSATRDTDFTGELKYENRYATAGLSWKNTSLQDLVSKTSLYYYDEALLTSFGQRYFLDYFPKVVGLRQDFDWSLGADVVSGGGGLEVRQDDVAAFTFRRSDGQGSSYALYSDASSITLVAQTLESFAYLQDKHFFGPNFSVTAGLRYDKGGANVEALCPRLGAEWRIFQKSTLKAAWGIYERSPSGQELMPTFGNPQLGPNLTEHRVLGIEQELGRHWLLRLESYLKIYRNRVVEVADSRLYTNDGEGFAQGQEIFLRYDDHDRFFGWLSYAHSISERDGALYAYDQPDILSLVANAKVTEHFELGATWHLHSGSLITPIIGSHYDPVTDKTVPDYGEPYSVRLGDYSRVDMRAEYHWVFGSKVLSLYLEVINLLNAPNPLNREYSKDFRSFTEIRQLPRLPYFGIRYQF